MRPVLLDAFCGAGGACRGYQEAGFTVVGVDINPPPTAEMREVMGIDWMTQAELFEAIPPAYTRFIGQHLATHVLRGAPHAGLSQSSNNAKRHALQGPVSPWPTVPTRITEQRAGRSAGRKEA